MRKINRSDYEPEYERKKDKRKSYAAGQEYLKETTGFTSSEYERYIDSYDE